MSDAVPTATTTTTTTTTRPAPAPAGRRAQLPRLLSEPMWVLGLVVLVDEIDKNIVRGMITPLKAEFGVGDLGISVMLSLALLLNGLVTLPAGYLADRWNRSRAVGHTVLTALQEEQARAQERQAEQVEQSDHVVTDADRE